jgi:hypothetical protein
MNIEITDVPSPSKLITTMDRHPVGAALFVVLSLILAMALVACCWMYFSFKG